MRCADVLSCETRLHCLHLGRILMQGSQGTAARSLQQFPPRIVLQLGVRLRPRSTALL